MIDIRVWMSLAYPAYGLALLLLVAVEVAGHVGLGAQRWITLGPLELQPSELMKISLVLALARFLHGKSVEEVSKPLHSGHRAGDDRHSGRVRGAAAQSRHHADHRGGRLFAAVPGRPVLVVDRAGPGARSRPRCRWPGALCCTTIRRRG